MDELIQSALKMVLEHQAQATQQLKDPAIESIQPVDILAVINGFQTCAPILGAIAHVPLENAEQELVCLIKQIKTLSEQLIPQLNEHSHSEDFIQKALLVRGVLIHFVTEHHKLYDEYRCSTEGMKSLLQHVLFDPELTSMSHEQIFHSSISDLDLLTLKLRVTIATILVQHPTTIASQRMRFYQTFCIKPVVESLQQAYQFSDKTLSENQFIQAIHSPVIELIGAQLKRLISSQNMETELEILQVDETICYELKTKVQELLDLFGQTERGET